MSEKIKEILVQIQKSQKKIRVKITVFLKKLEEIIFKKRDTFDGSTMRLVLIGQDNDLFGLMQICGIRSKYKGCLKNSSYVCIILLLRIFTEHPQKKEFLKIFYELDEDEFLTMKLSLHIMNEKNKDDSAYQIAKLIKERRPHLNLKSYIQEKAAQEKFNEWLSKYKAQEAYRQTNKTEWKDQQKEESLAPEKEVNMNTSGEFRPSNVRRREEKKVKQSKYFENAQLRNFERNIDYYKMTFMDPLVQALEEGEDDLTRSKSLNKNYRKTTQNKNLLKSVFNKKIIKPEDLIQEITKNYYNLDQKGEVNIDQIVCKIHIESPDFDPVVFLTLFHTTTQNDVLTQASKQLGNQKTKGVSLSKDLVYFYLDKFLDVHRGVMKSHLIFIQVESSNENGIFSLIKKSQVNLEKNISNISQELIKLKSESEKMRQVLSFLAKNELIIDMPAKLKKYFNRSDFELISKLFQSASPYLKQFKGMKIFTEMFIEIDRILSMSQDIIMSQIDCHLDDSRKMNELTNLLLDLQYDYNGEYIQNKKSVDKNEDTEENNILVKLIIYLEGKLFENIKMNTNIILEQELGQVVQVEELVISNKKEERLRKLKLISGVQFDSDRLVQFMFENNISENQRMLKVSDIESYFQENISRFYNFYSLLLSFQEGEYDYKLPTSGPKNLKTRNALKYFKRIFEAFCKAAEKSVSFLEQKYNFRNQEQVTTSEERNSIVRGKEDVISCSNIVSLLKQLDQKVRAGGKIISVFSDKVLKVAYQVQLQDLKVIQLEKHDFYQNLALNKTFTNEDEFCSPFSGLIFESILSSSNFITDLKIFRILDMHNFHQNFLLQAISISFKTVFVKVFKDHQHLLEVSSEFASSSSFQKDEVFLILISNFQSFRQYQSKQLLQQIFETQLRNQANNSPTDFTTIQLKSIRDLMQKMIQDLSSKLSATKAQTIVNNCSDLFVPFNSHTSSKNSRSSPQSSDRSSSGVVENNSPLFDQQSVYNISVLQQLQNIPSEQVVTNQIEKYEIRYKIIDILSEFDQYIQSIALHCSQIFLNDLPSQLLSDIILSIKKIIENNQKNYSVLLLKQIRIELEFLQDITVRIKSVNSQTSFSQIYSLIDKIFQQNLSSYPNNQQLYLIDKSKLKATIRDTKFKSQLNFKFFI